MTDENKNNAYYADRLKVALEILRYIQLPRELHEELGPVINDVIEAAARLREAPDSD